MQTTGMTDMFIPKVVSGLTLGATALAAADWSMAIFGVPVAAILAAIGGSFIAMSVMPKMKPGKVSLVVLIGFAIGIYGSQLIAWKFGGDRSVLAPMAFFAALFGHFGMMLVFKDGRDLVLGWARRMLGLPPGGGGAA